LTDIKVFRYAGSKIGPIKDSPGSERLHDMKDPLALEFKFRQFLFCFFLISQMTAAGIIVHTVDTNNELRSKRPVQGHAQFRSQKTRGTRNENDRVVGTEIMRVFICGSNCSKKEQ
jgi:hypothetical protein